MARNKSIDVKAEFKRLLAPRILKALKEDRRGTIPLRAAQRKAATAMLRISMTAAEIRSALARVRPRRIKRAR